MFGPKLRSPEAIKRRHRIRIVIASCVVLVFACLIALSIWGSRQPAVQIAEIKVFGASAISASSVEDVVSDVLRGYYLSVIPRSNVLVYPKREILATLRDRFPRIGEVTVRAQSLTTLSVSITERKPAGLWCGDIVPPLAAPAVTQGTSTTQYGTCYFLDRTGYLFALAPEFSGNPLPRYYGSLTHGEVLGQRFITPETFTRLERLLGLLRERGRAAEGILIVDEIEIEVYLVDGPRVLMTRTEQYDQTVDSLLTLLGSELLEDRDLRTIEYIDLRFGNKVYMREYEQPEVEPVDSTEGSED